MNDPHHNLAIFSIFDGHGGPVSTLSKMKLLMLWFAASYPAVDRSEKSQTE